MMTFTISVLSVLISVSGAGGDKMPVHKCIPQVPLPPEINASLLTFALHLQLLVELDRLFFSAIKGGGGEQRCIIQHLSG